MSAIVRRTRIKFCGMRRADDVRCATLLGVDAIGLILAPQSKRRLSVSEARALRGQIPPFVAVIALVMDQTPSEVAQIASILRPSMLQFHGSEPESDCMAAGLPYLKAIAMGQSPNAVVPAHAGTHLDLAHQGADGSRLAPGRRAKRPDIAAEARIREARADAERLMTGYPSAAGFVLDAHPPGGAGGSGQCFDWSAWPTASTRPLLLAGGLTPDTVYEAVRTLRPYAVDVSSGIESAPGIKCAERMARFVAEVQRADADENLT